jgi:hypothetical protein
MKVGNNLILQKHRKNTLLRIYFDNLSVLINALAQRLQLNILVWNTHEDSATSPHYMRPFVPIKNAKEVLSSFSTHLPKPEGFPSVFFGNELFHIVTRTANLCIANEPGPGHRPKVGRRKAGKSCENARTEDHSPRKHQQSHSTSSTSTFNLPATWATGSMQL